MMWQRILSQTQSLLFPPDNELGLEFREEIRRGALRGLRIACWMGTVGGLTFAAVDAAFLSEHFPNLLPSVVGTIVLSLAGIAASYTRFGQRAPRGLSVMLALWIGCALLANQLAVGSHTYGHFGGLTTILMVMAALGTLQPFWVLFSGLCFFSLYVALGLWLDATVGWPPSATFVLPCASLAVSVVISVWLAVVLDRSRRTEFRLRSQLAQAFSDLHQTQAQLLASEKALTQSQVVAALSHELNNPLGVVLSNLSTQESLSRRLLEKCAAGGLQFPEEISRLLSANRDLAQGSITAARRMASLLARLRQFSHLDRSVTQSVDLNRELLNALEMVKAETRTSIHVETHLNPLPELLCEPQKLGMAFASLLRNAFEAVGENGVVRLSTTHADRQVEVRIEDNGRGIDPGELKTIFDPKFVPQAGKVRTSWGLATSHQIFLQHGGQLELESALGKGTTARVRLPVA